MAERNQYYIGNWEYTVYFKEPNRDRVVKFVGVCENFCSNHKGVCAFWNIEKEQMLLIVELSNLLD